MSPDASTRPADRLPDEYRDAAQALHSARDLIRFAVSRFHQADVYFGHGTDNALDEANALVAHSLFLGPVLAPEWLDARLSHREREAILHTVWRRIDERLPLPYLTGEAWFAGLPFYVDTRVLIPRSPIAELIEAHFEPWLNNRPVERVLDMGAGSGCIAIACAHAFAQARIDAVDIDADALLVATHNVGRHDKEEQVSVIQSDLFSALPGERYDLIVSNPPYVDAPSIAAMPPEYRHEPIKALASGDDGLDHILRLLAQVHRHLTPGGLLIAEVGASQHTLIDALPEAPFCWLTFERGGDGVLLLNDAQLRAINTAVRRLLDHRAQAGGQCAAQQRRHPAEGQQP